MAETGSTSPRTPESFLHQIVGDRYQLLELVGRGGMGAVYEAIQLDLGRRVAVKVLLDVDADALARFRQEALASASINHPHVVQVTDLVVTEGSPPFIVMELLAGEPLSALLDRGPLPIGRAVRIASQTLAALAEAHRAGVVHRDVKPSNVFLVAMPDATDHAKLLDFGIAKLVDAGGYRTATGLMVGTPAYISPEQARGLPLDARADIHAMGLVLFEMIAGRRAFTERDVPGILTAVCTIAPPRLDVLVKDVPRALADVVARATAKIPAQRFSSADDMAAALAPWRQYAEQTHEQQQHTALLAPSGTARVAAPAHVGAGSTVYEPPAPAALARVMPPSAPRIPLPMAALPHGSRSPYVPIVVPEERSTHGTTRTKKRSGKRTSGLPVFLIALAATLFGAIVAFVAVLAYLGRL